MANIVIVSTTNTIQINFNALSTEIGYKCATIRRGLIDYIKKHNDKVEVKLAGGDFWFLTYNGIKSASTVDSIDGVAPTSNDDLYSKLAAIIK